MGRNLEKSRWVLFNPSTENKICGCILQEFRWELIGVSQKHFIGKKPSQTCHGRPPSVYCYLNLRSRYETGSLAWSLMSASWCQAHQGDQLSDCLIDRFRIQRMKGTVRGCCYWEQLQCLILFPFSQGLKKIKHWKLNLLHASFVLIFIQLYYNEVFKNYLSLTSLFPIPDIKYWHWLLWNQMQTAVGLPQNTII